MRFAVLGSTLVVLLLASLSAGCRRDPYTDLYIESLNSEYRLLEDRLYALEADYEQKLRELDAARNSNSTSATPAADRLPAPTPQRGPELDPPEVDPGLLAPPQVEFPEANSVPEALPPGEPVGPAFSLQLDPRNTRGHDFDGRSGDDGIVVVARPQDEQNRFVDQAARVAVVLLDPVTRGRVARWDFPPEEVAKQMDVRRQVMELYCPWPEQPAHGQLTMFIRYYREDGTHIQAQQDVAVNVSGSPVAARRWTPRTRAATRVARQEAAAAQPRSTRVVPDLLPASAEAPIDPEWQPFRD